jgi:hypothetical protein
MFSYNSRAAGVEMPVLENCSICGCRARANADAVEESWSGWQEGIVNLSRMPIWPLEPDHPRGAPAVVTLGPRLPSPKFKAVLRT